MSDYIYDPDDGMACRSCGDDNYEFLDEGLCFDCRNSVEPSQAEGATYCPQVFVQAWGVWKSKGFDPMEKLRIYETTAGTKLLYAVGLLDYVTLERLHFPSSAAHSTYEKAFADAGKALDLQSEARQ